LNTPQPKNGAEGSADHSAKRGKIMQRIILLACLSVALQACAKSEGTTPFHLGAPVLAEDDYGNGATAPAPEQRPELRHVASNKVLGAMAFQKITGRTVDASRLQGSR
jgi:hypothetical protein